ncbi:MAG: GNAT family N-acetyltransferase [Bacteroidetes bacterium]|nr:GNAT family N-acetyltransferase [Bacteroidota bacterium]
MEITYRSDYRPPAVEVAALYDDAGLSRPTTDFLRIQQMYDQSNLIVSAWSNGQLIGIARSLTDYCWCCYLSDLAVAKSFQRFGIGKALIARTKELAGEQSMVLLLSVDTAMDYYPKAGMETVKNGFILYRAN